MSKDENFIFFEQDYKEALGILKRIIIRVKLVYYFMERPVADFFLRKKLKARAVPQRIINFIDIFLNNEGGMFKSHAYRLCDNFSPIKGSFVLVPGIGYGVNLLQLAAWRPKKIVAFDLYEYREKWDFLEKIIKEKFGVELVCLKGDFDALDTGWHKSFDFIITDGVLEHAPNIQIFLENTKKFLKDNGVFYASFGPLWWGPGGDHITWGEKSVFNHILLSEYDYQKEFEKKFGGGEIPYDNTEGAFLVQKKLFSYLKVDDYLNYLEQAGFKKELAYAKVPRKIFSLLKENPNLARELDNKNIPVFDRFCAGLFLWLRLKK